MYDIFILTNNSDRNEIFCMLSYSFLFIYISFIYQTQVNEAQKRVADASFKVKNVLKKKQDVDVAIENLKTNLSVSQQRTAVSVIVIYIYIL